MRLPHGFPGRSMSLSPGGGLTGAARRAPAPRPPTVQGDVIRPASAAALALPATERSVDRWFNTSLFERDSKKQLDPNFQLRTFPRVLPGVRADGQSKLDASLIKQFRVTDSPRV